MVSSYFHHVVGNDRVPDSVVKRHRSKLEIEDPDDVGRHLPRYIEYLFSSHDRASFRLNWADFVRSWLDRPVGIVRYEGLLEDPVDEMAAAIRVALAREPDRDRIASIAEKHSFRAMARRQPGVENPRSFLRKGVAGDWKEKFTPEARQVFDHHAGDELVLAGYEPDRSWARATA